MDIKLLALDLDGTVLRSNNTLSAGMKTALEKAVDSGLEVAVASGRPYSSMPQDILNIDGIDWVIASNGASIYHRGERLRALKLREQDVLDILDLTKAHDLIWEAFIDGVACTDKRYYDDPMRYGCSAAYVSYVRGSRDVSSDMRGFIRDHRRVLDSIEFVCPEQTLRERLWDNIAREVEGVYITSSSAHFVEFMHADATKSGAVGWLSERLGIAQNEIAAAGNADNDRDMLLHAGLGVAVSNATPACLDAADWIVGSCDEDGVSELIERLIGERGAK
ncbi:Cof-type HAD-IIB family hydrolase [Ruminococcus difficilis]|uniref:HAD family phosphatase n=1 Tax=Ruminococcus difficilis TaxID=2763069 RepID=A0A934WSP1_9FIRM|nr:HAD family hydrolase [Ruminococcus difficilis]MBQ1350926.1 HAD family phosphatase [Ruminococcus sp.]SCX26580.1 hypothetical protein SAMN02910436_02128 [Ruminococcaceae bacterium P7]MBK6089214.1 HAD family phosphatase [Ruminococcus difficilis]MBQ1615767.1 HAD family phosphatase [Ruminococcus sp.]MBQ2470417.1 HAD family phosphatase [Ruminococcus sp.]